MAGEALPDWAFLGLYLLNDRRDCTRLKKSEYRADIQFSDECMGHRMKKNAPYIIVIVALAGALAWIGTAYASQQSRIEALETANQKLGVADELIARQVRQTVRNSLEKGLPPCRAQ